MKANDSPQRERPNRVFSGLAGAARGPRSGWRRFVRRRILLDGQRFAFVYRQEPANGRSHSEIARTMSCKL